MIQFYDDYREYILTIVAVLGIIVLFDEWAYLRWRKRWAGKLFFSHITEPAPPIAWGTWDDRNITNQGNGFRSGSIYNVSW